MSDIELQGSEQLGMTDLVRRIVIALVDTPEHVRVEASADSVGTLIRIQVDQSDLGKVIGKQGRTARSLRVVLGAASMKVRHRFSLDIQECEASPNRARQSDDSVSLREY